jgi:phosphoglycolate phosphatase-like HAD superfamily hydrolase
VIRHFDLQSVSKYVRQVWDFVNLYSNTRGSNRFIALIRAFDLLKQRKEVMARKVEITDLSPLVDWVQNETKLGNPALEQYAKQVNNAVIDRVLGWTKAVNACIADMVYGITPFPYMAESLETLHQKADSIVVSQTPYEALLKEWSENGIDKYMRLLAGQECGTKTEHIQYAARGKYPSDKILMIGDAPGDLQAAKSNEALFYPINPGQEEQSWERFYREGLEKFFTGRFQGDYQESLIREFETYLPTTPPW